MKFLILFIFSFFSESFGQGLITNDSNSATAFPQPISETNNSLILNQTSVSSKFNDEKDVINITLKLNSTTSDGAMSKNKLEPIKILSNESNLNYASATVIAETPNLTLAINYGQNNSKNFTYTGGFRNSNLQNENVSKPDDCSEEETKYVILKITSEKVKSINSDSPLPSELNISDTLTANAKTEEESTSQKTIENKNDNYLSSNNEISSVGCSDNSTKTQNDSLKNSNSDDAFQKQLDENVKYMPVSVITNKPKKIAPKVNQPTELDDSIEIIPSKSSSRQRQISSLIPENNQNLQTQASTDELSDEAQHFQNYYSKYYKRYYEKLRSSPTINPSPNLYKYMPLMYANYDNSILDSPAVFHPSINPQCPCTNNKALFCDCDELNIKNIPKAETIVLPIIQPIIHNRIGIANPIKAIEPVDSPCDVEEEEECGCDDNADNQDPSLHMQSNQQHLRKNLKSKQIKTCCDCDNKNINNANLNNANLLSQKNTLNKIGSVVANNYSTVNYNKHIHNFINGADFKFKADNDTGGGDYRFKQADIIQEKLTVNEVQKLMDLGKFENEENCTKFIVPPIKVENVLTDLDQTEKILAIKNKIPKRIVNKIITKKQYEELEPIIFAHENFTGVMNQAVDNTIFDVKTKRLRNLYQSTNKE